MKDLQFVGIGGATALELGGNCAYLKDGNTLFLIDCCEEVSLKLKEKGVFKGIDNIIIAITHTHVDHVAGLGTLIWYSNFILNIKPKIIRNSRTFEAQVTEIMRLTGVKDKYFEFISPSKVIIDNCTIKMIPTEHTELLECYGIMFSDENYKYYYSGDTKDFDTIKKYTLDDKVKKIYCEVCWDYGVSHLTYNQIKTLKKDKLILMHFEDKKLLKQLKKDGYRVAKR